MSSIPPLPISLVQLRRDARAGINLDSVCGLLDELLEQDPGAVKAAILRAFMASGGDHDRAAAYLQMTTLDMGVLIGRLNLWKLLAERWPNKF